MSEGVGGEMHRLCRSLLRHAGLLQSVGAGAVAPPGGVSGVIHAADRDGENLEFNH